MKNKRLLLMLALVAVVTFVPPAEASSPRAPTRHSVVQGSAEADAANLWIVIQHIIEMIKTRFLDQHG